MATWELFANLLGKYYTIFIVSVAHCCFVICCMSFNWPSPVLPKLMGLGENPLGRKITEEESELIGSIFYLGAGIGPLLFITFVEWFGRKKALIFLSAIAPIAYGVLSFAKTIEIYYACRVVIGFYVGSMFSVEPVYVLQIVAPAQSEFYVSLMTVFGVFGVVLATCVGPFISVEYFNGLIAIMSLVILILIVFGFPESPYDVMTLHGKSETRNILEKLREGDVEEELLEIENTIKSEGSESCFAIFKSLKNIKSYFLATTPLLLQSWSGVALLVNFSQLIFLETKIELSSEICSIIVALLLFSTTFITPLLLKSKKVTPRMLLMLCLFGVGLCDLLLSFYFFYGKEFAIFSWLPLITLISFVLVYNCGLDPLPWYYMGTAYPINISAVGTAMSSSTFQFSVFPLLFLFYKLGIDYLFLFSGIWCFFGIFYVKFVADDGTSKKGEKHAAPV